MKKFLLALTSVLVLGCIGQYLTVSAAATPPALGGTGSVVVPSSGDILIGNGVGTYTPALLTPGTDIVISDASGSVTIAVQASQFLPSSTVYVATVNGQSGAVTITSSTLGVATNTISLFNGNGFTTTTIQAVLNALSASGLASYNPSTGAFTVSSSSLALGSASHNSTSDFLPSSTVYVSTVNGQSGAVTITSAATTTINNTQAAVFHIIGDGTTVTSTVNGATTTFSILTTGNWVGTWQGVNSSTFYLATNPNNYISSSTGNTLYYPLTGNPSGFLTSAPATTTINGALGSLFNFVASSTGSVLSITSSTQGGSSTITFLLQLSSYLKAALQSLNGATSSAQTVVATGPGIAIVTTGGVSNSTTTVQNIGVTSFTGNGCVTAANSTGTVTLSVTCISGNQNITFTINGDATGTASGATAITDSITVTGLNGKALPTNTTGTLQFSGNAWKINLATSSLGVYDASGNLSSYIGSSCSGGQYVTGFSATGTVACGTPAGGGVSTSTTNTFTVPQNFNGVNNTGNVTTTNESITNILSLSTSTPSGTLSYPVWVDQNGFLNIGPITGNTPGSGASSTQEYNIIVQNCPNNASTSNQSECTFSQSEVFPDGSRIYYDHTIMNYAGTYLWGNFVTATGGVASSSYLPVYVIEFTDKSNTHAQPFTIAPVNSSTVSDGFNIAINNDGGETDTTGFLFQSGQFLQNGGTAKLASTTFTGNVTGTAANFFGPVTLSAGVTSPLTVNGAETSTITGDGTPSVVPNFDTILYVPTNFATVGCAGSSTAIDFGACVNALYQSDFGIASSVEIMIPAITVPTSSWQVPITFTQAGELAFVQCVPDAGYLNWGGVATTTAITYSSGIVGNSTHVYGYGEDSCSFGSSGSYGLPASTTAIAVGGANSGEGISITNSRFYNFGLAIDAHSNTWIPNINYDQFVGNTQAFVFDGTSNSGEDFRMIGDDFNRCYPQPTNCVVVSSTQTTALEMLGDSFTDAQVVISTQATSNNLSQSLDIEDSWFEDPGKDTENAYDFLVIATSSLAVPTSGAGLTHDMFVYDASSSVPNEYISNGGRLSLDDISITRLGTSTPANFVTNVGSGTITEAESIKPGNQPFTNFFNAPANTLSPGIAPAFYYTGNNTTTVGFFDNGGGTQVKVGVTGAGSNQGAVGTTSGNQFNIITNANNRITVTSGGLVNVGSQTASTTLQVDGGANLSSLRIGAVSILGCLELADGANSSTLDYIYASSTALVVTATKPSFCQ